MLILEPICLGTCELFRLRSDVSKSAYDRSMYSDVIANTDWMGRSSTQLI